MAAADEDYLPPVTDDEGNIVPLTDFGGMDDAMAEEAPSEVRRATANIPETGVLFNLEPFEQIAQLHAAGRTDEARKIYDSLDEQAKYVYNNARNMERFTAQEGARLADEFRKNQDKARMAAADPRTVTMMAEKDKAKLNETENAYKLASDVVTIMDRLRGFAKGTDEAKGKTPKYFGRVGAIDSLSPGFLSGDRQGWYIDHEALMSRLSLAEAALVRGQGPLSDAERAMLRAAASGGLDYRRDDKSYAQIFEDMYDLAKRKMDENKTALDAMKNDSAQPQATPSAAPAAGAQQTKKVGNQTWVRTPDGWLPQR